MERMADTDIDLGTGSDTDPGTDPDTGTDRHIGLVPEQVWGLVARAGR